MRPTSQHINGPSGALEVAVQSASNAAQLAVLCHPHPLYGGSLHDRVLGIAVEVLLDHHISCVRFNFRGVGGSEGRHDDGKGEQDDLAAVWQWCVENHPTSAQWLVGYSFGAHIAWESAPQLLPAALLLIAPPFGRMAFSPHSQSADAVFGSADEFVDANALAEHVDITAHPLANADHFFSTDDTALRDTLDAIVKRSMHR